MLYNYWKTISWLRVILRPAFYFIWSVFPMLPLTSVSSLASEEMCYDLASILVLNCSLRLSVPWLFGRLMWPLANYLIAFSCAHVVYGTACNCWGSLKQFFIRLISMSNHEYWGCVLDVYLITAKLATWYSISLLNTCLLFKRKVESFTS